MRVKGEGSLNKQTFCGYFSYTGARLFMLCADAASTPDPNLACFSGLVCPPVICDSVESVDIAFPD